jgi:tetratricopeptide (TPR) repeat protein
MARRIQGIALAGMLLVTSATAATADIAIPGILARPITPGEKLFQAGVAALNANDLARAEESFRASLKLDAKAAAPYMGLAQVALRRGQNAAAEQHMKTALSLAPETASIQTSWGTYLYSQRELPEAEAALRKAAALEPNLVVARVQLGDLYLSGFNKPLEAIKEYQAAIAIDSKHAGAHYALGLAHIARNDLAQAEPALAQATKLAPSNPLPFHTLGLLYAEQRKTDQALAMFAAAIKAAPGFATPHVARGTLMASKGDDNNALKEFAEAHKKDPRSTIGLTNIAVVHQRNQRWAEAEAAYLSAVKIQPKSALAYNNLAWMAADRKVNLDQALAWANKAVSLDPTVPEFLGTLGWVHRGRGDLAKAEETLRKATSIKPQSVTATITLGRILLERGKKSEAAAAFKQAIAIDPNYVGANEARQRLKELGQG